VVILFTKTMKILIMISLMKFIDLYYIELPVSMLAASVRVHYSG